ncbi:glutamate/aspartate transport system substrate-binding protein [Formivibrio citricus]|uniref:Glutamate/aspartate transport system substrate-binding protein n=1 Tax=Formivibrio citricus TaxID=83765 RepID=A0A1I4WFC8_9NEIS|nr:transporter substrate-binding domain-containing protein [Formivibrio citricus]SFN11689.1 glutamate/aspartate transport system substrate-binding protein [Formivibrio citricus]
MFGKNLLLLGAVATALFFLPASAAPMVVKTYSQEGFEAKYAPGSTQRPGICIEIMRAIEKLDPGVKFIGVDEMATTARVEEGLTHGQIDVFFGHIKTPDRAARFVFSGPYLYKINQVLVARKDDTVQVNDWDDVRKLGANGVVLAVKGIGQVDYLKSLGGIIVDDNSRLISANLKKLVAGRGRFYYGSENSVREAIEKLGMESQVRILPKRFQKEAIYVSFSRKAPPELVNRINEDLARLERNGELRKIRTRYQVGH